MNCSFKLILASIFALNASSAVAGVNFGVSFNVPAPTYTVYTYAPAPVYVEPVYVPAPVVRHRVYAPRPKPSIGFSIGSPDLACSFNIPLTSNRTYRDDYGLTYWEVHNNTDVTVKFINYNGERVSIPAGRSKRVDHTDSFKFTVLGDGQRFKAKSSHHYLIVEFDENEELKVYSE